jgi:hypothetical protein
MKVSEILSKAADLIEPEGAWLQAYSAKNADGEPVSSSDARACKFCIYGAMARICDRDADARQRARDFIHPVIGTELISIWNDAPERTQAEVVSALREASTLAKEQEDR